MSGFIGFLFNSVNPVAWVHYLRAAPKLLSVLLPAFGPFIIILAIEFLFYRVGVFILWVASLFRPGLIHPYPARSDAGSDPFVSVIIPGWNEERSIARTLSSVLHCGYSNLEVIFVDDGSDDGTLLEARKVANTLRGAASCQKLRIFSSPRRNGKAGALNIGLSLARGEFVAVIDADSELQVGAMRPWLAPFANPRVGAVAANVRALNAEDGLLTRLIETEYAFRMTLSRLLLARIGLLSLIPGPGGLFRTEAMRAIGGYDPGLGEDGDLSLRLLKAGWKLDFSLEAVVWTAVPTTLRALVRQRTRWARNTVMIRLSKHADMLSPQMRYGFVNLVIAYMTLNRLTIAWLALLIMAMLLFQDPGSRPMFLTGTYALAVLLTVVKVMIVRDFAATPPPRGYLVCPIMPFYRFFLLIVTMSITLMEILRLNPRHPYVPRHMWREIPHW